MLDSDFGIRKQDLPVESEKSRSVTDLVIADLNSRREDGKVKYGKELLTYNGRDPLLDLYQELHDALVYCRQELQEREDAQDWRTWGSMPPFEEMRSGDLYLGRIDEEHAEVTAILVDFDYWSDGRPTFFVVGSECALESKSMQGFLWGPRIYRVPNPKSADS